MKTLTLKDLDGLDVLLAVARQELDANGEIDVVIKKHSEAIRDSQRGLYWVWLDAIDSYLGWGKDAIHKHLKEIYLVNIFIMDPDNHPEFVGVVEHMAVIKRQAPEQYPHLRKLVLNGVSIMDATKDNMRDYLREVEGFCVHHNVKIPAPPREGLY